MFNPTLEQFRAFFLVANMTRAALAIVLLLALVGCGGGKTKTVTAPSSGAPSKQEFIAKGDDLCRDFQSKSNAVDEKLNALKNLPDQEVLKRAIGPLQDAEAAAKDTLVKFRSLTPPAGDEGVISRYLQAVQDQIAGLASVITAAKEGNAQTFTTLFADLQKRGAAVRRIAQGYGFKACGSS